MRLLLLIGLQVVSLYAATYEGDPNRIVFRDSTRRPPTANTADPNPIVFRDSTRRPPTANTADPNPIVFRDSDRISRSLKSKTADPEFRTRANEAATSSSGVFAANFIKAIAKEESGNFICSPISSSMLLSMLSYGTAGKTKDQLRAALALPENDDLAETGFQNLVENLTSYKTVDLKVANRIFLGSGIRSKPKFRQLATNVFRSSATTVDFDDSQSTCAIINSWCEEQTNSRIKNIIKPDDIDSQTKVVLLNAVYFKGLWSTKFDPKNTKERSFYVDGKHDKKIMSMFVRGKFRFGVLSGVKSNFIELPYKSEDANHNVSMFIILPWEYDGLAYLEENFDQVTMRELSRRRNPLEIALTLPKFRIESTMSLEQPLRAMGMKNLFEQADLSELVDYPGLHIDQVIQKAFIEIDESGSEAAAVTVASAVTLSFTELNFFAVDHPFLVVIATVNDNPVNLFTARFTGRQ